VEVKPASQSQPQAQRRDAARTRQLLVNAARIRFARDGYAATTVREIAEDAGVNVALINRYFTSNEGLFRACLATAVTQLRDDAMDFSIDQVAAAIAERITGSDREGLQNSLLLLLRSSGDERADQIRREILRSVTEQLAKAAGAIPGTADDDPVLLRAQLVMASALGIVLLRTSLGVQPLTSATAEELTAPLSALVSALLPKH
jgi:AcrR family transcriptional regulator